MTTEEAEAVHIAAQAFGITKVFNYRLMATTRHEVLDGVVEAVDEADFERILREDRLTHDERAVHDIEGDEIVYYTIEGDDPEPGIYTGDEIELDMRQPGEPFSWDACDLVKQMARLTEGDVGCDKLRELISKAKKLCEVDNATPAPSTETTPDVQREGTSGEAG